MKKGCGLIKSALVATIIMTMGTVCEPIAAQSTDYNQLLKNAVCSKDANAVGVDYNEDGEISVEDVYIHYYYHTQFDGKEPESLSGCSAAMIDAEMEMKCLDNEVIVKIKNKGEENPYHGFYDYGLLYDSKQLQLEKTEWGYENSNVVRIAENQGDYVALAGIIKAMSSDECLQDIVTLTFSKKENENFDASQIELVPNESVYQKDADAMRSGNVMYCNADTYLGSVNGMKNPDLADAQKILKFALRIDTPDNDLASFCEDIDGDGSITLEDAAKTLRMALSIDNFIYADGISKKQMNRSGYIQSGVSEVTKGYTILNNMEELLSYLDGVDENVKQAQIEKYKDAFESYHLLVVKMPVHTESLLTKYCGVVCNKNHVLFLLTEGDTAKTQEEKQLVVFVQIPKELTNKNAVVGIEENL